MNRILTFYITFEISYKGIGETFEISEKHFTKNNRKLVNSFRILCQLKNYVQICKIGRKQNAHGINNGINFFQLPNKIRNVGSRFSACSEKTKTMFEISKKRF